VTWFSMVTRYTYTALVLFLYALWRDLVLD